MHKIFVNACDVRESDVLCFGKPRSEVRVEPISSHSNGRIGFHANSDTWSAFYDPHNRVRIAARGVRIDPAALTA